MNKMRKMKSEKYSSYSLVIFHPFIYLKKKIPNKRKWISKYFGQGGTPYCLFIVFLPRRWDPCPPRQSESGPGNQRSRFTLAKFCTQISRLLVQAVSPKGYSVLDYQENFDYFILF